MTAHEQAKLYRASQIPENQECNSIKTFDDLLDRIGDGIKCLQSLSQNDDIKKEFNRLRTEWYVVQSRRMQFQRNTQKWKDDND